MTQTLDFQRQTVLPAAPERVWSAVATGAGIAAAGAANGVANAASTQAPASAKLHRVQAEGRAPRARNSTVYGGSSTCHWRRCRDIPDDICLKEIN